MLQGLIYLVIWCFDLSFLQRIEDGSFHWGSNDIGKYLAKYQKWYMQILQCMETAK